MPMYRRSLIVLLTIAVAVLIGTIYGSVTSDDVVQLDAATTSNTKSMVSADAKDENEEVEPKSIFVYVTGAVNNPGMVELPIGKGTLRVDDAVKACGDVTATADTENFNRAEEISDGQHIHIPEKRIVEQSAGDQSYDSGGYSPPANQSTESTSSSSKKSATSGGIVNINTAGPEELQTLKGIGPKMAERIIEYRQTNGPFKSIEEFQNVRGIGPKTFEKLKPQIRI